MNTEASPLRLYLDKWDAQLDLCSNLFIGELGKCFSMDLNVETGFLQLSFDLGSQGGLNDIFPEEGLPSFHAHTVSILIKIQKSLKIHQKDFSLCAIQKIC